MIFQEYQRTDWQHKRHEQSGYKFMDTSAWPIAGIGRSIVNKWAELLPADNEFISKIKSTNDRQHDAALFELLFFAFATSHGLPIKRIPAGEKKSPDFSVNITNQPSFFECTLVSNALYQESVVKKVSAVNQMIDDLNGFGFFVSVNYDEVGLDALPKKPFTQFLLDLSAQIDTNLAPGHSLYDLMFEYDEWKMNISFTRKNENIERNLGGYTQPYHSVNNFKPLYASLHRKRASNYSLNDSPYVICLGIDDMSAHHDEFTQALFGLSEDSPGFFVHRGEPLNTGVSAVFFCEYLKIFGLPSTKITCYHHPYAVHPLQPGLLPVEEHHFTVKGIYLKRIISGEEIPAIDVLKIDKELYFKAMELKNRMAPGY